MIKYNCIRCGKIANKQKKENGYNYKCTYCRSESEIQPTGLLAIKAWNDKNIFTEKQRTRVLKHIIINDKDSLGTYKRDLVKILEIDMKVLNRITKSLYREGKIGVVSLVNQNGRPGYFGCGFIPTLTKQEQEKILNTDL